MIEHIEITDISTDRRAYLKINELLAVAEFLGPDMTEAQSLRLMDAARELSVANRELLLEALPGGALYTQLSMHNGEMGGLSRY
jgi:hypothetical protein